MRGCNSTIYHIWLHVCLFLMYVQTYRRYLDKFSTIIYNLYSFCLYFTLIKIILWKKIFFLLVCVPCAEYVLHPICWTMDRSGTRNYYFNHISQHQLDEDKAAKPTLACSLATRVSSIHHLSLQISSSFFIPLFSILIKINYPLSGLSNRALFFGRAKLRIELEIYFAVDSDWDYEGDFFWHTVGLSASQATLPCQEALEEMPREVQSQSKWTKFNTTFQSTVAIAKRNHILSLIPVTPPPIQLLIMRIWPGARIQIMINLCLIYLS